MSLATRCTACGTVFRVVQDQLKVSEGWVRCGRCKDVFNALEGLFDLDREAPPEWRPSQQIPLEASSIPGPFQQSASAPLSVPVPPAWPPPSAPVPMQAWPPASTPATFSGTAAPSVPPWRGSSPVPMPPVPSAAPAVMSFRSPETDAVTSAGRGAVADVAPLPAPAGSEPAARADGGPDSEANDARDFADARFNQQLVLDDERAAFTAEIQAFAPAPPDGMASPQDDEAPAFVREAHQRERWRQPGVRLALAATAVGLLLLLSAQAALHFRDDLAAGSPGWKRVLEGLCGWTGCRIEPPRRLEDIAVESSALTRVASGPVAEGELLRLSVTLRNRATHEIAMPMIELSLTDPNGQLVSRRALSARDFDHPESTLPALGETAMQLQFSTGDRLVAGYTVEVFYP